MVGIVVEHTEESPEGLKGVLLAPDAHPLLSPALLDLSAWIAHHYGVSGGVALKAMMPGALWGRSKVVVSRLDDTAVGGGLSTEFLAALARRGGRASLARLSRDLARPVWEVAQRLARERAVALETVPPNLGPAPGAVEFVVLTHALPSLMERERIFGRARRQRERAVRTDRCGGRRDGGDEGAGRIRFRPTAAASTRGQGYRPSGVAHPFPGPVRLQRSASSAGADRRTDQGHRAADDTP